jgi:hypothetical protein
VKRESLGDLPGLSRGRHGLTPPLIVVFSMTYVVPERPQVQVRVKVSPGKWLWMNLRWYGSAISTKVWD